MIVSATPLIFLFLQKQSFAIDSIEEILLCGSPSVSEDLL